MHFHNKGKYFGFLDLHAHAARKGVFIYGNSADELEKQTQEVTETEESKDQKDDINQLKNKVNKNAKTNIINEAFGVK